jgi:hypothetical protein
MFLSERDADAEIWVAINVRENEVRTCYSRKCLQQVACGDFAEFLSLTVLPSVPMAQRVDAGRSPFMIIDLQATVCNIDQFLKY